MNDQQLARANELMKLIPEVEQQLKKWESATRFKTNIDLVFDADNRGWSYADSKYTPFDVVKTMSIQGFKNELAQLKKEFDEL